MSGAVANTSGAAGPWWGAGGAADEGASTFLDTLVEAGGGVAGAAIPLTLLPSPAGPPERTGAVDGVPGLSYTTRDDETSIRLVHTDADGQVHGVGTLTKGPDDEVYDRNRTEIGRIGADGTLFLDRSAVRAEADADGECRAPGPDGPTNRNAGLPPALRSDFRTARLNAYAADPQLKAAGLAAFGPSGPDCAEWQAHHLIPMAQVRDFQDVFQAAAQDGWTADEPNNVVGLPHNTAAQDRLAAVGSPRPLHDNAHQTNYSRKVSGDMIGIRVKLRGSPLTRGSAAYNQLAHHLVEAEQAKMRDHVQSLGMGRLTMADPADADQAA